MTDEQLQEKLERRISFTEENEMYKGSYNTLIEFLNCYVPIGKQEKLNRLLNRHVEESGRLAMKVKELADEMAEEEKK